MSLSNKVLARCKDYNGHDEVLWMMKSDDFRFSHPIFSSNYEVLDSNVVYNRKEKKLVSSLYGVFNVFSDWSLLEVK